jgi:hypothetical protein
MGLRLYWSFFYFLFFKGILPFKPYFLFFIFLFFKGILPFKPYFFLQGKAGVSGLLRGGAPP